jgi:hypothetical protein
MADVPVVLSLVGGEIVPNGKRERVQVGRGKTVAWKSDEGDVTISLPDAPLAGAREFSSRKGEFTADARVLPTAPLGFFECTASIGKKVAKAWGIEIIP